MFLTLSHYSLHLIPSYHHPPHTTSTTLLTLSISSGANTLRESTFLQSHGNDLGDAWQCIKNYLQAIDASGGTIPTFGANKKNASQRPEDHFLYQAWDFYFAVFKRINTQLPQVLLCAICVAVQGKLQYLQFIAFVFFLYFSDSLCSYI